MILSVHQPQYIPWLGYFDKIAKSDCFVFLDNVQYKEREFQNRNKIRVKGGWIWLSAPVASKGLGRQNIRDVKIDNAFSWQGEHFKSVKTWYAKADYLNNYLPFFADLYTRKWAGLAELNIHIVTYVLKELGIATPVYFESRLGISSQRSERIIDICKKLNADTYLSGIGGKDYLEENKFSAAGIKLVYQDFKHPVYRQQFMRDASDFIPYMSVLDLLFNEGVRSRDILLNSKP